MAFRFFKRKVEQPHDPLAQVQPRALVVEDIMREICVWLGPRDLAALTLTTKLFKAMAQEELWRTYANLDTLLFALPRSVLDIDMNARRHARDYIHFKKDLVSQHWDGFRTVASKIQRLEQGRINIRPSTLKRFLFYQSNGSPPSILCPQIRTLFWTATDLDQIDAAKLFMSPSLKHVRFRLGDDVEFPCQQAMERILDGLSSVQPPLESFEIVSFLQYDYHPLSYHTPTTGFVPPTAFSAYPNLRSVHIPLHSFAGITLHHLSMLPYLDTLRFGILQSFSPDFGADVVTFNSLVTLGINAGAYCILPLLNAMKSPRLVTFEFCSKGTDHDAILERFEAALIDRLASIPRATLIMPYWDVGVDTVMRYCTAVTQEIAFYGEKLSLPRTYDILPPNVTLQRLTLRVVGRWGLRLPLTYLPDLLSHFPSLTHIEIGLDAMREPPIDTITTPAYRGVQELGIYPGPFDVGLVSVAAFLASVLPSATVHISDFVGEAQQTMHRELQDGLAKWGEVIRIVPIIQCCLSVERHRQQTESQREISDLQARLKLYESSSSA